MKTIMGAYPNAFTYEEAVRYFKGLKSGKKIFDPQFELLVRKNFSTQEAFENFINELEKTIKLDITSKHTNLTVSLLVEYILVVDDELTFRKNGIIHWYNLENYTFTINDNT